MFAPLKRKEILLYQVFKWKSKYNTQQTRTLLNIFSILSHSHFAHVNKIHGTWRLVNRLQSLWIYTPKSKVVFQVFEMSQLWCWKTISTISSLLRRMLRIFSYANIKRLYLFKLSQILGNTSLLYIYRCKYLYLLYDDAFLVDQNYIFTTKGHPLPVRAAWHERLSKVYS